MMRVIVPVACGIICLAQSLIVNQGDAGETLGLVYNHLSFQHIASRQFHRQTKERLAKMMRESGSKGRVGLIGVEKGGEVQQLNKLGYDVIGFEANPRTYSKQLKKYEAHGHARFVYCGISDARAQKVPMEFHGIKFDACLTTLDAELDEHLAILSVDIQGMEPKALQGSQGLIQKRGVDMLWVEVQPSTCHDVLNFMSENGYVIFDTEWWGHPKTGFSKNVLKATPVTSWYASKKGLTDNFQRLILNRNATRGMGADINTYCQAIQSEWHDWLWVQMDIVGIHKSAYKKEFGEKLAAMGA